VEAPSRGTAVQASSDTAVLIDVDPGLVEANPEQPRRDFDHQALVALGESIRTHGLLHPIVVERSGPRYRLVAGERRLRAVRLAGLPRVPAIVRPAAESARQSLETALTENLLRSDLSAMEEAAAYSRLADTFGLSHEAIAMRLGRSRPAVSNTIRLLALAAPVQDAVAPPGWREAAWTRGGAGCRRGRDHHRRTRPSAAGSHRQSAPGGDGGARSERGLVGAPD